MSLEQKTRDYEVLIRLNADGTYGAQYQSITEITNDGVVIAATVNAPVPLSVAAETTGTLLSTILGDTVTNALLSNETLQANVTALQGQVDTLTSDKEAAASEISTLTGQVSELGGEITSLNEQLAALQAQIDASAQAAAATEETPAAS